MEIRKALCLSTSHVTRETAALLDSNEARQFKRIIGGDYDNAGWFIYCSQEQGDIPDDLFRVMQFALQHDCQHLLFDRDADLIAELPWWEW